MNIKKGDTVKILIGKDSGKTGKVSRAIPKTNKVFVEGLNLYKKHVRAKRQGEKGEVISLARPMSASNVAIVCSHCNKQTRIGARREGDKKVRICAKCEAAI